MGPQLDAQGGCWSSRVWQAWEVEGWGGKLEELEPLHALGPGRQPTDLISIPGNIRVLCRLRPGTPSSLVSLEPGPSGTVTTCYRGRQRRFRLDWVFSPEASQEEVMLHPCPCADLPSYCPRVRRGSRFPFIWLPQWLDSSEGKGGRNDSLGG